MSARYNVFCVPFPGAGHAINMFHVALTLATPTTSVYTLVHSSKEAKKWMNGTGQPENAYMHIHVIGNGKWEDWHGATAMELFALVQSDEWTSAIGTAVSEINGSSSGRGIAMVINGLMFNLIGAAKRLEMKSYLLYPIPYYFARLASCHREGDTPQTRFALQGIGGRKEPLYGELGDVLDSTGPMYYKMFKPSMDACDGIIYSNTNTGLEGDDYQQKSLIEPNRATKPEYFLGPILPSWYEDALEKPEAIAEKMKAAAAEHECIRFMNEQKARSVVYVGTGSHIELEITQAKTIIDNLRKHGVRWILLFRNDTEEMRQLLGGDDIKDGVVASWVPQLEVLVNPALKCVISHGGFGTMIEGIYAGQCFITTPVASDQFIDTKVMMHLGIGLGTIAENRLQSIMGRAKLTPFWPDDGGKHLSDLFTKIFGTNEGDVELRHAREASLALRARMKETKARNAPAELSRLLGDMSGA